MVNMERESKSSCCACGERVIVVPDEVAESESAEEAVEGMGLPKKYERICESRTDFIKEASRSTHPPDFVTLTTDIRSREEGVAPVATVAIVVDEDVEIGLLSYCFTMEL